MSNGGDDMEEVEEVGTVMYPEFILKITPRVRARWSAELDDYFHDNPNQFAWIAGTARYFPRK